MYQREPAPAMPIAYRRIVDPGEPLFINHLKAVDIEADAIGKCDRGLLADQ
jgi:hypothetical protein